MNDTEPERTDGVRYLPANSGVSLAPAALGFVVVGVDIDEAGVSLRVVVQSPDDPYMVARRRVSLPLGRGADGDLIVGTPKISSADPESEDEDALF